MTILYCTLGGIISLVILIFIIGLILPAERIVTRESIFDISPQRLYDIVTNNDDWGYRSDLKELNILERNGEHEVWEEVSHHGNMIRFWTKEKIPYSFYSFGMSSGIFDGYWTADFKPAGDRGTHFIATEYIRIKNPFIKTLSYLFFNIGKFMETYQADLKKKVDSLNRAE